MAQLRISTQTLAILATLLTWTAGGQKAWADSVQLDVHMSTPVMLEGQTQNAFLKIGLTGSALQSVNSRTSVNVAIVLDRSGSMSGQKMQKAREAAIMAVQRLGPEDIVSVIAYNHTVEVLVPATKVRDKDQIYQRINSLYSDGNTALFAGVSKGAYEVRKFIDRNRVNRVILVSDGLANVGPSTPGELGDLGYSLSKEGISVTTIGLGDGYNEDLMVALAQSSDGNHAFAENASDLARIFSHELGDVLSVVARQVRVDIQCAPGIKPLRILGRKAEINGQRISAYLNQIYAKQEKFILVEVEIPASSVENRNVASVNVRYANTVDQVSGNLKGTATVRFAESMEEVDRFQNKDVLVASAELIANEANKRAIEMRDQGRTEEARRALESNAQFLEKQARKYESKKLQKRALSNRSAKDNLNGNQWNTQRKRMRRDSLMQEQQMMWE